MNVWFIFKRELKAYFGSPVAYVLAGTLLLITGIIFSFSTIGYARATQFAANQRFGQFPNLQEQVLSSLFATTTFIFVFLVPLVTMRLFSEEQRSGTMEMLLTFPLREIEVVLGKFFAAWVTVLSMLALMVTYPLYLTVSEDLATRIEWFAILTSFLGIGLLAGAFVAIGMFMSSLSESQVIAAFGGFGVLLLLWIVSVFGELIPNETFKAVVSHLSFTEHLRVLVTGVIETKSVVYYINTTFVPLFLTFITIQSKRWRA